MSGECESCGEHALECKCGIGCEASGTGIKVCPSEPIVISIEPGAQIMKWINIKDRLPNPDKIVIIKFKSPNVYICIARFLETYHTSFKDFKNVFITMVHPRFPKSWLFDEKYEKISIVPKKKVDFWMTLPLPPKQKYE